MNKPQWSLAALLSAMLFAAVAAAGYRAIWSPNHPNALAWLAIFLAVLMTATLGAWRGHLIIRRACLGYAAFGWADLAFVQVLFGWNFQTIYDAERMTTSCQTGLWLGLLAAIAATWILPAPVVENR
jgi:hypothetical protein